MPFKPFTKKKTDAAAVDAVDPKKKGKAVAAGPKPAWKNVADKMLGKAC